MNKELISLIIALVGFGLLLIAGLISYFLSYFAAKIVIAKFGLALFAIGFLLLVVGIICGYIWRQDEGIEDEGREDDEVYW